jgi:hypothetical protein
MRLRIRHLYTSPDAGIFNVWINGALVLDNFDVVAAAGGAFRAVAYTFTTNVTNQQVTVYFSQVYENPEISAIEVR